MAKSKKKSRKKNGMVVPVGIVAGFMPLAINSYTWVKDLGWQRGIGMASSTLIGYNYATGSWDWNNMRFGALPIFLGMIVSRIATRFGLNAKLARTGLPIRL